MAQGSTRGTMSKLKSSLKKSLEKTVTEAVHEVLDGKEIDIDGVKVKANIDKQSLQGSMESQIRGAIPDEIEKEVTVTPVVKLKKIKDVDLSEYVNFDPKNLKKRIQETFEKAYNPKTANKDNSMKFIAAAMVGQFQGIELDKQVKEYLDELQKFYGITGQFKDGINAEIAKIDFSPITDEVGIVEETAKKIEVAHNQITKSIDKFNKRNQKKAYEPKSEQLVLSNSKTGYSIEVANDTIAGTSNKHYKTGLSSAKEKIDSILHSHPNELTSAFSFDDIEAAIAHKVDGIIHEYVLSLEDVTSLDISKFSNEQLKSISEYIKKNAFSSDSNGHSALNEVDAFDKIIKGNIEDYINEVVDVFVRQIKEEDKNVNAASLKSKIMDSVAKSSMDSYKDFDNFYDLLYEKLSDSIKSLKISGDADFADFSIMSVIGKANQLYQEGFLKEAIGKYAPNLKLDEVYKKTKLKDYFDGESLLPEIKADKLEKDLKEVGETAQEAGNKAAKAMAKVGEVADEAREKVEKLAEAEQEVDSKVPSNQNNLSLGTQEDVSSVDKLGNELQETGQQGEAATDRIQNGLAEIRTEAEKAEEAADAEEQLTQSRKKRSIASSKDESAKLEEQTQQVNGLTEAHRQLNNTIEAEPVTKSWQSTTSMQEFNDYLHDIDLAKKGINEIKQLQGHLNKLELIPSDNSNVIAYRDSVELLTNRASELGYVFDNTTQKWRKAVSSSEEFKAAMRQSAAETDNATQSQEKYNEAQRETPTTQTNQPTQIERTGQAATEATTRVEELNSELRAESQIVSQAGSGETQNFNDLRKAVDDVTESVKNKTKAFTEEKGTVESAVEAEKKKLKDLKDNVNAVTSSEEETPKTTNAGENENLSNLLSLLIAVRQAVDEKTEAFGREGLVVDATVKAEYDALTLLLETLRKIADVAGQINIPAGEKLKWANDLKKLDADAIQRIGTNLQQMYQSISKLNVKDSNFVTQLNQILAKGEELKNLAKVLSSSQKDINKTKENIKSDKEKAKETAKSEKDQAREKSYNKELEIEKKILTLRHEINKAEAEGSSKYDDINTKNTAKIAALEKERELVRKDRGRNTSKELRTQLTAELKAIEEINKAEIESLRISNEAREQAAFNAQTQRQQAEITSNIQKEAEKQAEKVQKEANDQNEKAAKAYKELTSKANEYYRLKIKSANDTLTGNELNELKRLEQEWDDATQSVKKYMSAANGGGSDESREKYNNALNAFNESDRQVAIKYSQDLQKISDKLIEVGKNSKYTQELKDDATKLANTIIELNKNPIDISDPQQLKDLEKLKSAASEIFEKTKLDEFKTASADTIAKLNLKIEEFTRKNSKMGRKLREEFQSLKFKWDTESSVEGLKQINTEFVKLETRVNELDRTGLSFFDKIKNQAVNTSARFISYYFSFMDIIRYSRQAFESVRELDTALVDLKKTTTMSAQELNKFYFSSNDVAKSLGTTTAEIINQAAAWSRLGYSTNEEATAMAKLSAQFAAISPGMDLEKSTDGLVSSMKAFGIQVDDVQRSIMDNINRIGNTMATSNDEIVDMLTRSSAAMNAANNTIEQTIALESAAVQITRNAETTGTAFRTISMRIKYSPPVWRHAGKLLA